MRLLRSLFLVALLALAAVGSAAQARRARDPQAGTPAPGPPNIVLILADDLGWGDVGYHGRKEWSTPNLDRLAREGTIFDRWYCAGVVCAPSRAALMTGRYGIHNGVVANNDDLPAGETTIAEALKARGYATGLFGKWHHGKPRAGSNTYVHPMDQGFDEFFGFTDAVHAWQKFPKELWEGREMKPVQGYSDDLFTARGIDFIRRHRDRPFFLYLPYIATHLVVEAPPEEVEKLKGRFAEKDPEKPLNATYAAEVVRLDQEVGQVVKTLDDLGLGRDTLLMFSSDHGATFEVGNQGTSAFHDSNRPFRGQKRTLWEGGIRVPTFVRWTGTVPAGRVSQEVVHNIDVLPSFLAAGGGTPDPAWQVDGLNLLPVLRGEGKVPGRTLFWEWRTEGNLQLAAMRGDRKLVITGGNLPELFDVVTDPGERRNRSAELPEETTGLRKELEAWLATESAAAKEGKAPRR